ncbi:hypothetical protein [Fulvivirga ligni]|uniref:hypothetical protein n=1 Tax=Fulvivirga ligni TaxID=2904246 RepID=UPI001F47CFC0|nr:hypothetical protein [Fulvivirga ligni]UII20310.1 hypothetical protein LVD16_20935 [Fulvivirga ligni]
MWNNFKRFLFEFVIVTLGVLAAFSISKLDENRKLRAEELASYKSLKEDLEAELYVFNYYKQPLKNAKAYLKPILAKQYDEIDSLMSYLNASFDLQERNATYINLKFSGKLEILHNEAIKKRMTLYYETYYQGLESISQWNYDFRLHFLMPFLVKNLKYNDDKENLLRFLNNDEFLNLIQSQYQMTESNISTIEKSEKLIARIIEEIDKELGVEVED